MGNCKFLFSKENFFRLDFLWDHLLWRIVDMDFVLRVDQPARRPV